MGLRRADRGQRQLCLGAALHLSPRAHGACRLRSRQRLNVIDQSGEGEIRKAIIEADLVDCMVALPGQLFYSTQIPVCLWFLARNKRNGRFRDRRGETLFIDARKMGSLVDRIHRELNDAEIAKIASTYHAWRGDKNAGRYTDVPGFCKAASLDSIQGHGYALTPSRYVGAERAEDEGEPFEGKMQRLAKTLYDQMANQARPMSPSNNLS